MRENNSIDRGGGTEISIYEALLDLDDHYIPKSQQSEMKADV